MMIGRRRGVPFSLLVFQHGWWWLLLLAGGFCEAKARPPVMLTPEVARLDLAPLAGYLRDPGGTLTWADVRVREGELFSVAETRPSFGFTSDALWMRVVLRSESPQAVRYLLELASTRFDEIDWHVVEDGRLRAVEKSGLTRPKNPHLMAVRNPVLPVVLEPGRTTELYLRVRGEMALRMQLTLWTPDAMIVSSGRQILVDGVLLGCLIVMGVVAVSMALLTKDRGFLMYSFLLPCVGGLCLAVGGYYSWLAWPASDFWERQGVLIWHALRGGISLLFLRYFFDLKRRLPRVDLCVKGLLLLHAGLLVSCAWLPYRAAIRGLLCMELALWVAAMAGAVCYWNKGLRGGRILISGWLLASFLGSVAILQFFGAVPTFIEMDRLALGVIFVGTLGFLVALGVRVREIRCENERNQREALHAQEEMSRQLERQVQERTAELRRAKENVEQANRFKGLFLANLSHEIRAPISTLVGLSQALWMQSERQGLSEEFRRFLNQIRSGGQYLNMMLTNLLDVTAAEAGRIPLHWTKVGLAEWSASGRDLLDPIAVNHGITLGWTVELRGDPQIETDPLRLTQVLLNLVHNAIKFTPRGRRVDVLIQRTENALVLRITDEGPGIPPEDLISIFEAFSQSSAVSTGGDRGVGLGLSVVKTNVDLLGGRVHVANREVGGACFTVTLPDRNRVLL